MKEGQKPRGFCERFCGAKKPHPTLWVIRCPRVFEYHNVGILVFSTLPILTKGGIESNEFRIDFYQIFRTFFQLSNQSNCKFSNQTNLERI